jgi:hypothetical protein
VKKASAPPNVIPPQRRKNFPNRYQLDPKVGGKASGIARSKRRDEQIRRKVQSLSELSNLADMKYRPVLQSLARISILTGRAYAHLKARKSLLNDDGELCNSIDAYRRLEETRLTLLKALGLTPSAVLPNGDGQEFEAAFERIEKMKVVRAEGNNGKIPDA